MTTYDETEDWEPVHFGVYCAACGAACKGRRWALVEGLVMCAECVELELRVAYDRVTVG